MMKSNKNIEVNIKSPSARKVWIEIDDEAEVHFYVKVTFREEGVD